MFGSSTTNRTGVVSSGDSGSATDSNKKLGFFRAKVVEVDIDDNAYGVIRVFLPSTVTTKDEKVDATNTKNIGQLAYPANSPMGGRNDKTNDDADKDNFYQGSVYVPNKGSWVWCFFEDGNQNKIYYFSTIDIENTKLPPENRLKRKKPNKDEECEKIEKPHQVYTVLKSHAGRAIIVADSSDVQRIEITGKKRKLDEGNEEEEDKGKGDYDKGKGKCVAAGNFKSVYAIEENQTTILFDERDGQEKILIKSHKGDYINFDIENRKLQVYLKDDIIIQSEKTLHIECTEDIRMKCKKFSLDAESVHIKASDDIKLSNDGDQHYKAGGNIHSDSGSNITHNSGSSSNSSPDAPTKPEGKRDKE